MRYATFSLETRRQASAFDQVGEQYERAFGANPTQVAAVQWLSERLAQKAHILDVGCGTGVPAAKTLVDAGHDVLGIDISREMLRIARQRVPRGRFQLMDVASADFAGQTFHAIVAFFSLLMLRKATIVATVNKLARSLAKHGYFVMSMVAGDLDYVELSFLGTSLCISAYRRDELEAILQTAGLRVLEVRTANFTPRGGGPAELQLFFFCQRLD